MHSLSRHLSHIVVHAAGLALLLALWGGPIRAEALRIATYDPDLTRRGPGLLVRDIERGEDPRIAAVARVIAAAAPDILLLTGIDYDFEQRALAALAGVLSGLGADYAHRFALRPNAGMATGIDMDGDGRRGDARDAQGYGRFAGQGGMAILSKRPIVTGAARDFSGFLWRDLSGADLGPPGGAPVLPEAVLAVQRLASVGFWAVPVAAGSGEVITLLAYSATPPVFDGPDDRNGRRNHDETAFWLRFLDGGLGSGLPPPSGPVVVLGKVNVDPGRGEGRRGALAALLAHPRLTDPVPAGADGRPATVDWPGDGEAGGEAAGGEAARGADTGPGDLRVSYILPDRRLRVTGAGVFWPAPGQPLADVVAAASPHRLVWVDVELP